MTTKQLKAYLEVSLESARSCMKHWEEKNDLEGISMYTGIISTLTGLLDMTNDSKLARSILDIWKIK